MPGVLPAGGPSTPRPCAMSDDERRDTFVKAVRMLDNNLPYSSSTAAYKESGREAMLAKLNDGRKSRMYGALSTLDNYLKYTSCDDTWKQWKRAAWWNMFLGKREKGVDTKMTWTHLAYALYYLEYDIKYSSFKDVWKQSKRDEFLSLADSITDPVEASEFALDLRQQMNKMTCDDDGNCWKSRASMGRQMRSRARQLRPLARSCDDVARNCGIARTTGGATSVVGGVLAIGGVLAAPFSAGASLAATVAGTSMAVAGGVTSFGSSLAESGITKDKVDSIKDNAQSAVKDISCVLWAFDVINVVIEVQIKFSKTPEGQALWKWVAQGGKGAWKGYKIYSTARNSTTLLRWAALLHALAPELSATGQSTALLARELTATGLTIPRFAVRMATLGTRNTAIVVIEAGSVAARGLGALSGVLSIGFGIWDIIAGAKSIGSNSAVGNDLRKFAKSLEDGMDAIDQMWVD